MPKLECDKLHIDFIFKQIYAVAVKNKYKTLEQIKNSKWNTLREAWVTITKRGHSKRKKERQGKLQVDDRWLNLIKERLQILPRDSSEYMNASMRNVQKVIAE